MTGWVIDRLAETNSSRNRTPCPCALSHQLQRPARAAAAAGAATMAADQPNQPASRGRVDAPRRWARRAPNYEPPINQLFVPVVYMW